DTNRPKLPYRAHLTGMRDRDIQPPTLPSAGNSTSLQPGPLTPQMKQPHQHKAQHLPLPHKTTQGDTTASPEHK
ncbi:Hypothetical predicted protein, partial [Pelobates cultripes]